MSVVAGKNQASGEVQFLQRHEVRGEERWTGRALLDGREWDVMIVAVGGQWVAFKRTCPHVTRDLLKGTVSDEGTIECPSHGWVIPFADLQGRIALPQADGGFVLGAPYPVPEGRT